MMFHQPANNSQWTTTLQRMLFGISLLLVLLTLLPDQVMADDDEEGKKYFCFTKLNGTTCNADSSGIGNSLQNTALKKTYRTGFDLTFSNLYFNFRAYKGGEDDDEGENDEGEDDEGERERDSEDDDNPSSREWEIFSEDIKYCGNVTNAGNCTSYNDQQAKVIPAEFNYIDKATITIFSYPVESRQKWQPNDVIKNGNNQSAPDTYYSLGLTVLLEHKWLSTLLPGDYKVRIRIRGREVEQGNNYSTLDVILPFTVPESLKITVPETFPFGTFSEGFSRYKEQPVCAHAQGEAGFKIRTESRKGGGRYALVGENTEQLIAYEVAFGPNSGNMVAIPYGTSTGSIGDGFTGHINAYCIGPNGQRDDNMRLGITLESFENISTKPADIYSDTLTLYIEPN